MLRVVVGPLSALLSFKGVEKKDTKKYGEFLTKRLCLGAYGRFANDPAVVAARPEVVVA